MPRKHGAYGSVREAILDTAALLFTQCGIHATSLGDIAEAAKLSKGTLYYYYPAKEELVLTIADSCLAYMTDAVLTWADGLSRQEDLRTALLALLHALQADERQARLYIALCGESAVGNLPLRKLMQRRLREWVMLLEVGALKLQDRTSPMLGQQAELFFALLSGCMLQRLAGIGDISEDVMIDAVLGK
ncbi:MAG: TetR/AcrR family transcriptional regulator [Christensenellaceae bacterium]|jgi:AcrR family transcriptional regulator|nr:TetR/AcrR family transcriptional regulator [Christensenellaceae bacterium]